MPQDNLAHQTSNFHAFVSISYFIRANFAGISSFVGRTAANTLVSPPNCSSEHYVWPAHLVAIFLVHIFKYVWTKLPGINRSLAINPLTSYALRIRSFVNSRTPVNFPWGSELRSLALTSTRYRYRNFSNLHFAQKRLQKNLNTGVHDCHSSKTTTN